MIIGEHEHLRLARESPERGGVQDSVAIALEAGAIRVGRFRGRAVAGADGARRAGDTPVVLQLLASLTSQQTTPAEAGPRVGINPTPL